MITIERLKVLYPEEIVKLLDDGQLNRARRVFSQWYAKIEQASSQNKSLNPIELRRMEFMAVLSIIAELGNEN